LSAFVNGTSKPKKRVKLDENETPPPSELTAMEQVCFFELYQKHGSDVRVRDMEVHVPLKAEDRRARDMLTLLLMVDREHMQKELHVTHELRAKVRERDARVEELQKAVALLAPIDAILRENKEMQALVFKQNSEKRVLQETVQKLERQLADVSKRISEQYQQERNTMRKSADTRLNDEYWKMIELINKMLYTQEVKNANEIRDAIIEFADQIRLILHPI